MLSLILTCCCAPLELLLLLLLVAQAQMERMLLAAALPLLADIQLQVPETMTLEVYPSPVPDLFCGQPLLVAGKFEGEWPEEIVLTGLLPTGEGEQGGWGLHKGS